MSDITTELINVLSIDLHAGHITSRQLNEKFREYWDTGGVFHSFINSVEFMTYEFPLPDFCSRMIESHLAVSCWSELYLPRNADKIESLHNKLSEIMCSKIYSLGGGVCLKKYYETYSPRKPIGLIDIRTGDRLWKHSFHIPSKEKIVDVTWINEDDFNKWFIPFKDCLVVTAKDYVTAIPWFS